jgi:hypothetical protein
MRASIPNWMQLNPFNQEKTMQDLTGVEAVEVMVRDDGQVIWINVDGRCVLRVSKIEYLEVNDERTKVQSEQD